MIKLKSFIDKIYKNPPTLYPSGNGAQQFISIPVSLGGGGNHQIQLLTTSNGQIIATNLGGIPGLTQPLNLNLNSGKCYNSCKVLWGRGWCSFWASLGRVEKSSILTWYICCICELSCYFLKSEILNLH